MQALVKVEDLPKPHFCTRTHNSNGQAAKKYYKNSDLPPGSQTEDRWRKRMVTTAMWWLAQRDDPWNPGDEELLEALQLIWDVIYVKHCKYTIVVNDAVFSLVGPSSPPLMIFSSSIQINQRFCDSWCNAIANRAIQSIITHFETHEGFETDEEWQSFAQDMINNPKFLYQQSDLKV